MYVRAIDGLGQESKSDTKRLVRVQITPRERKRVGKYDRFYALNYAHRYWSIPCNNQFIALASRSGRNFVKVPTGTKFEHEFDNANNSKGREHALLPDGSRIEWEDLDDCTHYISCCIGLSPGDWGGGIPITYADRAGLSITGNVCPSGRGKCWPWAGKRKDIVDPDVPWNDAANRRPENYNAVLDYFNVGNSLGKKVKDHEKLENGRYRRKDLRTWCNIYVHDVTRAMWANIPHWVGKSELNANRTVRWLDSDKGRTNGWIKIDQNLKDWIRRMTDAMAPPPFPDSAVRQNLRTAAWRTAKSPATDRKLLTQASYVAQQFANQGLPTVVVWENCKTYKDEKTGEIKRNSGHVAMIRPENSLKGKIIKGTFVPRSAQAGGTNWTNELATIMATRPRVMYFVHE